jgi:hypothetical protein
VGRRFSFCSCDDRGVKTSLAWIGVLVAACGSTERRDGSPPATTVDIAPPNSAPASTATPSAPSASPTASATAAPAASITITITEGKPETVMGSVTIAVGKILYAHLSDSQNLSLCEVTITRDGKTESKTLERRGPITFTTIAGLEVGIESVDPYHQPSTATLVIGH